MSYSQFYSLDLFIILIRHAWLNLWDAYKRMLLAESTKLLSHLFVPSKNEHHTQAVSVSWQKSAAEMHFRSGRSCFFSKYLLASLGVPVHTKQVAIAFTPRRVMAFGAFASLSSRSMRCGLVNIAADTALVEAELWIGHSLALQGVTYNLVLSRMTRCTPFTWTVLRSLRIRFFSSTPFHYSKWRGSPSEVFLLNHSMHIFIEVDP